MHADTPLSAVSQVIDLTQVNHVLVERDDQLIGIVEAELICSRLQAANVVERQRWEQMTIESALQWKISAVPGQASSEVPPEAFPIQCTAIEGENGISALVSGEDVYVSWQVIHQSLNDALTDPVTQLPNRKTFERRIEEEISRATRKQHSIAVILFDVDHFKEVNDAYGHSVGDAALQSIADLLKTGLRSYDVLARYGGDEFAAICCGCGENEIDIPVSRVLNGIKASFASTAIALPPLSLSIGAAVIHEVDESVSPEDIMELADMCLYRSKDNGRDCAFKLEMASLRRQTGAPKQVDASAYAEPTEETGLVNRRHS